MGSSLRPGALLKMISHTTKNQVFYSCTKIDTTTEKIAASHSLSNSDILSFPSSVEFTSVNWFPLGDPRQLLLPRQITSTPPSVHFTSPTNKWEKFPLLSLWLVLDNLLRIHTTHTLEFQIEGLVNVPNSSNCRLHTLGKTNFYTTRKLSTHQINILRGSVDRKFSGNWKFPFRLLPNDSTLWTVFGKSFFISPSIFKIQTLII